MTRARLWRINALAWTVLAAGAAALHTLDLVAVGRRISIARVVADLPLIALWALATPAILGSAKRFPVRGDRALRNGLTHAALGSLFVVATNVAIRLPLLAIGVTRLIMSTLDGIAVYYPGAIAMYAVIVAIGHRLYGEETPVSDDSRLVIREWNRVHFIDLGDIDWIEANNNHVVVHTAARVYKGRERISDVEARLDARRFVRVHRSAIVHLPKIREVQPLMRGDQAIVMQSGAIVRVARSRRQALEEALGVLL